LPKNLEFHGTRLKPPLQTHGRGKSEGQEGIINREKEYGKSALRIDTVEGGTMNAILSSALESSVGLLGERQRRIRTLKP
jgi:hypothetical protein